MRLLKLLHLTILLVALAYGQATMSSTTTSSAMTSTQNYVVVASNSGMTAPGSSNQINTALYIDRELMYVTSINSTTIGIQRGVNGTPQTAHTSGATVYLGPLNYFPAGGASGNCTASSLVVLPRLDILTGDQWDCPTSGPWANYWVKKNLSIVFSFPDGEFHVPISTCAPSVSDHGGTLGITVTGASNVYAMQAATSSSATTNTLTFTCPIPVPFRTSTNKGIAVSSVIAAYGVQTTALGTQVNTLASGTFNGSIVFSKIVLPVPAASETASTVTPVRADSGTLAVFPSVTNFNTGTTTAGGFYTQSFTPATPIVLSDQTPLLFTFSLQGGASPGTATVVNLFDVQVNYINTPL